MIIFSSIGGFSLLLFQNVSDIFEMILQYLSFIVIPLNVILGYLTIFLVPLGNVVKSSVDQALDFLEVSGGETGNITMYFLIAMVVIIVALYINVKLPGDNEERNENNTNKIDS